MLFWFQMDTLDAIGLLVIRNRVDYLEVLFMVGDQNMQQLLAALNLNQVDVTRVTTEVMKKLSKNQNASLKEITDIVSRELHQLAQVTHTSGSQAGTFPMSQTIAKKASVHYYRWKYAFQYSSHTGITEIKNFLDARNINHEDFFIEIANLFTITSTVGVHIHLIPNFTPKILAHSLEVYGINQPTTTGVVESLFCTLPQFQPTKKP